MRDNQGGYCHYVAQIDIRDSIRETQTIAAVVYELTHARLHDKGFENADVSKL